MNVREYLSESAAFLRDYITVESAVLYLVKKERVTPREIAAWFLQTEVYLNLMAFRIDRVRGSAEIIYDEVDARQLVFNNLRKIAEDGLSPKSVASSGDVVGWQIQDLTKRLPGLDFERCEISFEEYSVSGSQVEGLDVRERDSLLKLIIGMAVGGYGYDSKEKKSSVVSSILEDVERSGLAMSDETVRKYLKEASRLIERSK